KEFSISLFRLLKRGFRRLSTSSTGHPTNRFPPATRRRGSTADSARNGGNPPARRSSLLSMRIGTAMGAVPCAPSRRKEKRHGGTRLRCPTRLAGHLEGWRWRLQQRRQPDALFGTGVHGRP